MQGQPAPICTLAKNFLSDNGSASSDAAVDCQVSWENLQSSVQNASPSQANIQFSQHGGRSAEWCFGESSSSAAHERKLDHVLKISSTDRRYGEQGQHSLLQTSSPAALTQDLNLTAVENAVDYLVDHPGTYRHAELSMEHSGHISSRPNGLLSASCGFVEGEDRLNRSLDTRRLKRKAVEAACNTSGIGGSECPERTERSQWDARQFPRVLAGDISLSLPAENGFVINRESERASTRIRIGGAVSSNSPASTRDLNIDINDVPGSGNQVDVSNVGASLPGHSSRSSLRHCLFDLNLASGDGHLVQTALLAQLPRGPRQSRPRVASTRRTSSSSSSSGRRTAAISRRLSELPMFLPGHEIANSSGQPANWTSAGGNPSLAGIVGSIPQAGWSSSATSFLQSGWSAGSRHHQRPSELERGSLLSAGSGADHALLASAPNPAIPSVPSRHRGRAVNSRSGQLQRHFHGAVGVPYLQRTLTSEGRSMVYEQFRHVLDRMRRGEGLRIEDMLILDPSIFAGVADLHDRHRDLRMDVDNMTYEELLALEERIGNVCIGLSDEAIAKRLKKRLYSETETEAGAAEREPCCICREEYSAGEDLGELNCGHDFHAQCIKQWLVLKNVCPICKTTALNT